jgi:hypothetical protein
VFAPNGYIPFRPLPKTEAEQRERGSRPDARRPPRWWRGGQAAALGGPWRVALSMAVSRRGALRRTSLRPTTASGGAHLPHPIAGHGQFHVCRAGQGPAAGLAPSAVASSTVTILCQRSSRLGVSVTLPSDSITVPAFS